MPSFKRFYRAVYKAFGYPLSERTVLPSKDLAAAAQRLGVTIPAALRDYYLIAGRERRFSSCYHRLLPPSEWSVDAQRLIFMEENQSVVWWGVSTRAPPDNPPVFQGINQEPIAWYPEHRQCSVFLAVMLHYQAVSGGFRFCGTAHVPDPSSLRLNENGWTYCGEVNSLRAHSRANQVVCLMPPGDLPFMQHWSVLAGGKARRDLEAISNDLGIAVE